MRLVIALIEIVAAAAMAWWIGSSASVPLSYLAIALVIGACVGSFLNVVAFRWPEAEGLLYKQAARAELGIEQDAEVSPLEPFKAVSLGRSHCPGCTRALGAAELVPVLSWVAIGGRCRGCNTPVSLRYSTVELAVAVGTVGMVASFGVTVAGALAVLALWAGVAAALVDKDHLYLPPFFTQLMLLAVSGLVLGGWLAPDLKSAGIAALLGYFGVGRVLPFVFQMLTKREGLGQGDAILFAMLGAVYGMEHFSHALLGACLAGAVTGIVAKVTAGNEKARGAFAFGPAIIFCTLVGIAWKV